MIARIVVHSSRQSGLSAVYSELLDFDGCEIYTLPQPDLNGMTFGDALMAYDNLGADRHLRLRGRVYLNPPMETRMQDGFKAIIIAEDDAAIRLVSPGQVDTRVQVAPQAEIERPERTLILGWNRRGPMIAFELSRYVAPGSLLTIAADTPELQEEIANLKIAGQNLRVEYGSDRYQPSRHARNARHSELRPRAGAGLFRSLRPAAHRYPHAGDAPAPAQDCRGRGRQINVVSEMIDVRNRELAEVTRATTSWSATSW